MKEWSDKVARWALPLLRIEHMLLAIQLPFFIMLAPMNALFHYYRHNRSSTDMGLSAASNTCFF
jgi:hypothetical protein